MTSGAIFILALQGVAFAVWAAVFFRALFQIRAISVAQTGSALPGPGAFLRAAGQWMKDPAHRRLRLIWVICLAVMILASAMMALRT